MQEGGVRGRGTWTENLQFRRDPDCLGVGFVD